MIEPTRSLCSYCASPHQPDYLSLLRSAENGCQLCQFICRALGREPAYDGTSPSQVLAHVSEKYPGRQISLDAWGTGPNARIDRIRITTTGEVPDVESDDDSDETNSSSLDPTLHPDYQLALSGSLDIYTFKDDPSSQYGGISGRPLPVSFGDSDEDYRLVNHWLQECLETHTLCANESTSLLPTRVLHVGKLQEPQLIESSGMQGLYITLSHCWGGIVPLTTTTTTIAERKRGIPFASMPRTFRDAVLICRKLGVRYLWIDSLCIIQDSKEDWERESASMCDVYGRSYLTIAARGAPDANGGCFMARKQESPPILLGYHHPSSNIQGTMFIRDPSVEVERPESSVFDSRAWVLQERLLSQRVLYYGSQQLYWECNEGASRQDGKEMVGYENEFLGEINSKRYLNPFTPINILQQDNTLPSRRLDEIEQAEYRELEHKGLMARWYLCVSEYTRRKLSFGTDRLAAIAGVAQEFHRRTQYSYLAGLWREDLLPGLLWYRGEETRVEDSKSTVGLLELPTWSWARFTGRIHFVLARSFSRGAFEDFDPACEVLDISYSIFGALGNYGMIRDGFLKIRGRVIQLSYEPPTSRWDNTAKTSDGVQVGRLNLDEGLPRQWPLDFVGLLVCKSDLSPTGLALERVAGTSGVYKRIGLVTLLWSYPTTHDRDGRVPFMAVNPQDVMII